MFILPFAKDRAEPGGQHLWLSARVDSLLEMWPRMAFSAADRQKETENMTPLTEEELAKEKAGWRRTPMARRGA